MISSRRIVDFMILSISAWAVIATSKRPNSTAQPVVAPPSDGPVSASFTFESDCEDAVEKSGSLTIRSGENPMLLTVESNYPVGLPDSKIFKVSEIETQKGVELTYTAQDDERLCIAVIEDSIFAHAGTTTFSCYDNESSTVSCSVQLVLRSLEELTSPL